MSKFIQILIQAIVLLVIINVYAFFIIYYVYIPNHSEIDRAVFKTFNKMRTQSIIENINEREFNKLVEKKEFEQLIKKQLEQR